MSDIILSFIILAILIIPVVFIALMVLISSGRPILHWSQRIGKDEKLFLMPKFRSMRLDTPQVATDLLKNPEMYITPMGQFLRKTSLDELPQLWSVFVGNMSLVGPRPALFNQKDIIHIRAKFGINKMRPGITGWAQVNGRDEIPMTKKINLDLYYIRNQSFLLDLKILFITVFRVLSRQNISH